MTTDRKIFDFLPRRGIMAEIEYPGIAKLVSRLVWDQETVRSSRTTRTKTPRSIASGGFFLVYCGAGFEGDADFLRVLVICCRYAYNKKTFSLLDYIIIPKKGAYISMGFPSFFFIKYKLSDLVEVTALQNMIRQDKASVFILPNGFANSITFPSNFQVNIWAKTMVLHMEHLQ